MSSERKATEERRQPEEQEWARKLGRLRLGVEPLEDQLARYRKVTWALTIVSGTVALLFLSLFSVFRRPDIGLVLAGLVFGPISLISWRDYYRLQRQVTAYRAEREREAESEQPGLP